MTQPGEIAGLTAAAQAQASAAEELTARLDAQAARDQRLEDAQAAMKRQNWAILAVAVLVAMILVWFAAVSLSGRDASRASVTQSVVNTVEIKALAEKIQQTQQTLLSYQDPESEVSKRGRAQQAAVVDNLLARFEAAVRRGSMDTLEIRRCANDVPAFESCVAEKLPHLASPTPAPVP